jgi:hypothetical protein
MICRGVPLRRRIDTYRMASIYGVILSRVVASVYAGWTPTESRICMVKY